jgi:hypothetical protein
LGAAQAPDFVRGVQARVRAAGRAAVLRRLNADVTYARLRPAGSAQAIAFALRASGVDQTSATAAADRFIALGDTLRTADWAAATEHDQADREARLRAFSPPAPQHSAPVRGAVMDRILTLAALAILDATTTQSARVNALLDDDHAANCLTLTQLEYRQCVSVTQFGYENAFCLARHGVREPAACLSSLGQ